jgi:hypothetical protein
LLRKKCGSVELVLLSSLPVAGQPIYRNRRPEMKSGAIIISVFLFLFGVSWHPANAQSAQQELMKTCNDQATTQKLVGDARKAFMSKCLSGKSVKTLTPQQQKMTACNTQAGSLTGDARKKFMATCLKG